MAAIITQKGRVYKLKDIEEACGLIEDLFGKTFFKKGIELIKDSDPAGAGMGREYRGNKASKMLRAWHRVREELAYGGIEDYYRPGLYGALIGSLGEDLKKLSGVPGTEAAAAGLLDDQTFERTIFLLYVASSIFYSNAGLIFPGRAANYFYSGKYLYTCLSVGADDTPSDRLLQSIACRAGMQPPDSCPAEDGHILYADLPGSIHLHSFTGNITSGSLFEKNSGLKALVLCKTEFPSGTSGFHRSVSCLPIINKETSGSLSAEGLLSILPI